MQLTLPFIGLFLGSPLLAQTGPGGVGNSSSNVLWLDANVGVTSVGGSISAWADRSGNGNNATQATLNLQPVLSTNVMNGYPAVTFDNDQVAPDQLKVPDNASLEGMSGLTGFAVHQLATGTASSVPRCFFSKRNGVDDNEAYDWFLWNSGTNVVQNLDVDKTNNRASSSATYTTGVNYLSGFVYQGSSPSNSQNQVLYEGNAAVGNAAESSAIVPDYNSDLYLGILKGHTGTGANVTRFNGQMSEVILYNYALTSAQRTIVNNYLAAKYGLALGSGDLYLQDNVANGNFDHEVAGIGRVSATDLQTDSRGSGVVEISGATGLDNNEFLFWGHNNGTLGTFGVGDRPADVQGRWGRVWRVSEVNTSAVGTSVGAIDITFDLNGLGTVTASDLRLIVDMNNDGVFANETAISGATLIGDSKYRFSGVTAITNNVRFTLGTANVINTPLPIELLSFSAKVAGDDAVETSWSTASEHNNDHFTVERSDDTRTWQPVAQVPGAINSSSVRSYLLVDRAPIAGTSYYRLRQTDLDGTSSLSPVVVVQLEVDDLVLIYPNPAHDLLNVHSGSSARRTISISDMLGLAVMAPVITVDTDTSLDLSGLSVGTYVLAVDDGTHRRVRRVVVQ